MLGDKVKIEMSAERFQILKYILEETMDELSTQVKQHDIKDRKQILAMMTLQPLLKKLHADSYELKPKMKVAFSYPQALAFVILYTDKLIIAKPTQEAVATITACITTLDRATAR